jgi:hypothetical protein
MFSNQVAGHAFRGARRRLRIEKRGRLSVRAILPRCDSSSRLWDVTEPVIERGEVVALLFAVNDISVSLEKIRRLLGEEDDDGEEEEEADAG